MTQLGDEEEIERYVQQCTLFLLHKQFSNVPIKRTEIIKSVLSEASRRTVNEVLNRTKQRLKQVHGFNLIETNENTKSFMLINEVPWSEEVPLQWDSEERKRQTLLLPVLSVIFMSGGSITEGKLMAFLRKLKIMNLDSSNNPFFGDVERILKKVNNFGTLGSSAKSKEVKNIQDNEDAVYQVSWGFRAENEISKHQILEHVSQVYGCETSDFAEQFAEVS